jgi:iron complex outermembrane recepter protein
MAVSKKNAPVTGSRELAAAISAILAMSAGTAIAQTAESPEAEGLGEIIVTATRRSERLQDVPQSITAIDSEGIAIRGLSSMDDYAHIVPGLSVSDRQPGGTTIVFRGVATSGLQFGAVSSSALYLDEQPITQSGRNPDPRLIDVARIEALRGPQGTLYGASSQSGTLRVITNRPDAEAFDAWANVDWSTTSGGSASHDVSGMVNIPLGEKAALRIVGFTALDGGYIDNVLTPSQGGIDPETREPIESTFDNSDVVKKDVNEQETGGGRVTLRLEPNDRFDVTFGALFQNTDVSGHGDVDVDNPNPDYRDYGEIGDLQQVRFSKETMADDWYQFSLAMNAKLPFADAVLAASYFNRDFRYQADATAYENAFNYAANYAAAGPVYDFGGDPRGFATNHEVTKITTAEFRLSSNADGSRWSWIAGAFYSKERQHTEFDSYVRNYSATPSFEYFSEYEAELTGEELAPTDRWFLGRYDTELDQKAVFGELSFNVTDHFKITAGGRWFDYERHVAQQQEQPQGFSGFSRLDDERDNSEDGTVTRFNLEYKLSDDNLLYATYSEGFRIGGSNPLKGASLLPRDFRSDTLKNYEVGTKNEFLNHRLRLNLSAYFMEWEDFAVQIEDPQDAIFQLGYVNLPSANIQGVEGELSFQASKAWLFDASFSYNNAEVAEAVVFTVVDENDVEYPFPVEKGVRLPLTPEWSGSVGIEFRPEFNIAGGEPYARFDYSYVGSSWNSLAGIESVVSGNPPELQASYELINLRLGVDGEKWSAAIYGDNLTDERAELFKNNRWKLQRMSVNRPRSVGITVHFKF